MKQLIILLCATCFSLTIAAQQTVYDTITAGGLQRDYILYIPASYTPGTDVPLVMNFHGYTSNASQQMIYGDFRGVADTAGFLLVHPNGTPDNNSIMHWNVGFGGSTVDDVAFVEQMIDSLVAEYSIDTTRLYSTGMSNGGFMSYHLACNLSDRIAAIASVTGSMVTPLSLTCSPSHPMPVMEIHGTNDQVVPYIGMTGMQSVQDVLDFWIGFNNCDTTPTTTNMPNIAPVDLSTADWIVYSNGDNGTTVEHFRINNGGHTWPGSVIPSGVTNYDINASVEIWKFFSKYDLNGTLVSKAKPINHGVKPYPNPTTGLIRIGKTSSYKLLNAFGQTLESGKSDEIDLSSYPSGIYFLSLHGQTHKITKHGN